MSEVSDEANGNESGQSRDAPIPLDELDRSAISRVIALVSLDDVRLQHTHAEIRTLDVADDWGDRAYLLWRADLFARRERDFIVEVGFLVRYYDDRDPAEEPDLPTGEDAPGADVEVIADFELFYSLRGDDEVADEDLRHFAVFNGSQNAWGYMREYVQSITGRMGVRPFVAPVLPVPQLDKRNDD